MKRLPMLLLSLALCAPVFASDDDAAAQARELRGQLAQNAGDERIESLQRQLLASLERRRDLARTRDEIAAMPATAAPPAVPDGVLALDDLRRRLQQLDAALMQGERRRALLHEEREAAAARLGNVIAQAGRRREEDRDSPQTRQAALEARLVQSGVAEIDALLAVLDLQQRNTRTQRDALALRAGEADWSEASLQRDAQTLDARFEAETQRLEHRIAQAAVARDAARAALDAASRRPRESGDPATSVRPAESHWAPASAGATQREVARETLANRDIALELAREALANLDVERTAWRLALAYRRHADAAALIEARERGPAAVALLQRRHEFVASLRDQTLARIGEIDAQRSGADAADQGDLRRVLEERLQSLEAALLDQRRVIDLLARLREDFDAQAGTARAGERIAIAFAAARAALARLWDHELFAVEQVLELEGRQTTVQRGVTVGKVVKAPLLLLACLLLALRLTGWLENRARRRGVDAARARMVRRWTLGVLVCIGALASLALAGIPFAAFAFVGGALAIGLGFGMQSLVKNLVSGVLVLIERPFRLGDVIEVGNLRGTVVDIDLRASVLRESDGAETLIPNSLLVEQSVRNVTFRSRATRQALTINVAADGDPRQVTDLLETTAARHGLVLDVPPPAVKLEDFDGDTLRFALQYWVELKPGVDTGRIASDLRHMLHAALREGGVRLASPAACPAARAA